MRILLAVVLLVGCGAAEEPGTAESALVSTDPCGVTISPYNAQCTKPGRARWTCYQYNSVTHRCYRAKPKEALPGSCLYYQGGCSGSLPGGEARMWPGWDGFTVPSGAIQVPRNFAETFWGPLLEYGYSYDNLDLTPSGVVNGLQKLSFTYVQLFDGAGICLYDGGGFTGNLIGGTCFQSGPAPSSMTVFLDQYGYPVTRSFFTY